MARPGDRARNRPCSGAMQRAGDDTRRRFEYAVIVKIYEAFTYSVRCTQHLSSLSSLAPSRFSRCKKLAARSVWRPRAPATAHADSYGQALQSESCGFSSLARTGRWQHLKRRVHSPCFARPELRLAPVAPRIHASAWSGFSLPPRLQQSLLEGRGRGDEQQIFHMRAALRAKTARRSPPATPPPFSLIFHACATARASQPVSKGLPGGLLELLEACGKSSRRSLHETLPVAILELNSTFFTGKNTGTRRYSTGPASTPPGRPRCGAGVEYQ